MTQECEPQILCHGKWEQDGQSGHVWIIRQTWDYFHEDFYDDGPDLAEDGFAYYALFGQTENIDEHTSRSPTCLSKEEAIKRAEAILGTLEWLQLHPSS